MPAPSFNKPLEEMLEMNNISYKYYDSKSRTFDENKVSRICELTFNDVNANTYNDKIIMMVFSIRNQNDVLKIHSEGAERMEAGATIPSRNIAIEISKTNKYKYMSIAIVGENIELPINHIMREYVISIESYEYGNETGLSIEEYVDEIEGLGRPDFYRKEINYRGNKYFFCFVKKTYFSTYARIFDSRPYGQNINNDECKDIVNKDFENIEKVTGAENILLYGVPGVGKSHAIHQKYCNDETRMERVVFHPDYTYSDFVGQILPRVENEQLKYIFTPGPFTKMLSKAWNDPGREYYLIIEEINRGNAPAIFGEIFQLLDRKSADNPDYDAFEIGESEYGITNYDVATVVYGDSEHEVRIPSNMWVLATMNTADQNVFTLDTAFQRRWNMHHIKNDVMAAKHAQQKIEGTEIGWGVFATVINDMVVDVNVDIASSEDKRLGAYFVKASELASAKFPEKVLKYLWDDAFKMDKDAVFDDKYHSLEAVIETYKTTEEDKLRSVLRADVYAKMLNAMNKKTEE